MTSTRASPDGRYRDYRLVVEYRFSGKPGNCGVLIHASTSRTLYKMFPQSIEVQLMNGNAGDFWVIREDIKTTDMEKRRPRTAGQQWGAGGSGPDRTPGRGRRGRVPQSADRSAVSGYAVGREMCCARRSSAYAAMAAEASMAAYVNPAPRGCSPATP
jgi:hypothetical protein